MPDRRVAIFLSHGDEDALRLAGSCALASAAMGDRVDIYLFGPAVPAVAGSHDAEPDHPASVLRQARGVGRCRLVACSASVVAGKVDLGAAEHAFDAVVGWPTILEWTRGITDRFSF